MRRSVMLEKLRNGGYVVLTQSWIVPHWKMVDLMGKVGFDGVWIENEHSDFTYAEMSQMILAAGANDMDSLIRVERSGYNGIIKPLEAGATGIIVPQCKDGDDAKNIVQDAKYSPMGLRGAGGSVDADYGTTDRMKYFSDANSETIVAVIIENKEAVEDVDAIASTEGVDILLMGPGDLSQSYGYLGQLNHELVVSATNRVADACAKHGKWWGTPVSNAEEAQDMLRRGGRIVQGPNDQGVLVPGFQRVREMYRGLEI